MDFTPQQRNFINEFVVEISNGDAAIFAGAGLSASIGFVDWKGLLRDLAIEIGLNVDKENDLITLAQYYCNSFNRAKINDKIINGFTTLKTGSINHKILSMLNIDTFWTTNYDKLIEKTLEEDKKTIDVKIVKEHFARYVKKKDAVVYKMHGDKDSPHDAVLTKDDYDYYNTKRELFSTALRGDLLSRKFLFLGFSFDDPNLDFILSRIKILLEEHTPNHYCFFKEINEVDYDDDSKTEEQNHENFLYDQIKQRLKIADLKRYGINAVMVKDYSEITEILLEIETRIKRKNIFISGAAHKYEPYTEENAKDLIHKLSYKLAEKGYKIVSGYGLGIGSMVINGALDFKLNSNYRNLDDLLILRPFSQIQSGKNDIDKVWMEYRNEMIKKAGIAVFLFGNKLEGESVVKSNGMLEEFQICLAKNVVCIPVGATGYISKDLWDRVQSNIESYYPNNHELYKAIKELGKSDVENDEMINNILKAINILQKA